MSLSKTWTPSMSGQVGEAAQVQLNAQNWLGIIWWNSVNWELIISTEVSEISSSYLHSIVLYENVMTQQIYNERRLIAHLFLPCTVGGSERASGFAGVRWHRCRPREASWVLPSLQGYWSQHHSLQGGWYWRHNCYRSVPGSKLQHDPSVRAFLKTWNCVI